jgi:hypothetical protein
VRYAKRNNTHVTRTHCRAAFDALNSYYKRTFLRVYAGSSPQTVAANFRTLADEFGKEAPHV